MAEDDDRIAKLEGRIRALEALVLEMPAVTAKLVKSAKARVLDDARRGGDPQLTEMMLNLSGHLDEHAEEALDKLSDRIKPRKS
jgi:hypothetical protein